MLKWLRDLLDRITRRSGNRNLSCWYIDENSSPFAVPNAFDWLLAAEGADRQAIAELFARLMRKVKPSEWPHLYGEFRLPAIRPKQVQEFTSFSPDIAVEILGIATLSENGYVREAAVKALAGLRHRRAVPYILLRLGDWVPQVREAAYGTLRVLMDVGIGRELLECHDLLERLEQIRRTNLSPVLKEIRDYLGGREFRASIQDVLASKNLAARLFAYKVLQNELTPELMSQAASDPDARIRRWLVHRLAVSRFHGCDDLVIRLLQDKSSRISTTVIDSLNPAQIAQHRSVLFELAFSNSRPVRYAARYALRPSDFAGEARRRLQAADPSTVAPGVVASLGETGEEPDSKFVEPLLECDRPLVREAAAVALARLTKDQAIRRIFPLLDDPSGRVRRAAFKILARSDLSSYMPAIHSILESASERGGVQALRLISARGGWEAFSDLLRGVWSAHEAVRECAWRNIAVWYSYYRIRGWIKPSETARADLKVQLNRIQTGPPEPPIPFRQTWEELKRWISEELEIQ